MTISTLSPVLIVAAAFTAASGAETGARSGQLPWAPEETHRFVWSEKDRPIGRITFRIARTREADRTIYRMTSYRHTDREGTIQKATSRLWFGPDRLPVRFEEVASVRTGPHSRGEQEVDVRFSPRKVRTRFVNNGREDRAVRRETEVPEGTFLFSSPALEQWIILAAEVSGHARRSLDVYYPQFDAVLRIDFTREAAPRDLRVGDETVSATGYRFRTRGRAYEGTIWVDAKGRMLRYESGPLSLALAGS